MNGENKLRGMIVSQAGSLRKFAADIGWDYNKLYRIVTRAQEPDATDINTLSDALRITEDPATVVELFLLPWRSQNVNN